MTEALLDCFANARNDGLLSSSLRKQGPISPGACACKQRCNKDVDITENIGGTEYRSLLSQGRPNVSCFKIEISKPVWSGWRQPCNATFISRMSVRLSGLRNAGSTLLQTRAGGVGLQGADAVGEGAAALGDTGIGGGAVG